MRKTMQDPKPPKSNHYVSNVEFYQAMKDYKQACREAAEQGLSKPQIPKYIGECLYKIATKLSYRPNFINYSYRDEMIADGLENCITYFDNFNPDKSNNPFSYFTQIIYYAFLRRIQKEKKQVYVKHKVYHQQMVDGAMHHLQEGNSGEDFDVVVMEDTDYINDFVKNFEDKIEEKKKAKTAKVKKSIDTILTESFTNDPE
jgi:chloramphenicol O-acetyltransferase